MSMKWDAGPAEYGPASRSWVALQVTPTNSKRSGSLDESSLGQRVRVERHITLQQGDVVRLGHLELPCAEVCAQHIHWFGATWNGDAVLLIQLYGPREPDRLEIGKHPFEVHHALATGHHL